MQESPRLLNTSSREHCHSAFNQITGKKTGPETCVLKYPLTPVPYAIGTADGFLAKTDKSKGFHR